MLLAVTWVGGDITIQILAIRLVRTNDPEKLRYFAGEVEWTGTRVFTPAALLLLGLGIWMVILEPAWTFGQFWILAGIAMFAYSFLVGAIYLGPQSAKLKRAYEREGAVSVEATDILKRLFLASRIELALLILIVFDMVLKPGL